MPAYELFLIIKNLPRPDLVQSIKRGAEVIIKSNGLIRSFESMGNKNLPYRMKSKGFYHTSGNYMLIKFDIPSSEIKAVTTEIQKDADFLRTGISPLIEYDEDYDQECRCEQKGEFMKNPFNFQKPLTSWHKKKVYKNYGLRL